MNSTPAALQAGIEKTGGCFLYYADIETRADEDGAVVHIKIGALRDLSSRQRLALIGAGARRTRGFR